MKEKYWKRNNVTVKERKRMNEKQRKVKELKERVRERKCERTSYERKKGRKSPRMHCRGQCRSVCDVSGPGALVPRALRDEGGSALRSDFHVSI